MKALTQTRRLVVALFVIFFTSVAAQAGVALRGQVELIQSLIKQPPCCVIDARSADQQLKAPLADALRYRPGLQIVPTASVIVVADSDQEAVRIGAVLVKQHPGKVVYAVKGGVATWAAVLKSLEKVTSSQEPGTAAGISFVIPHNTCETGTPLQILTGKPKPKP